MLAAYHACLAVAGLAGVWLFFRRSDRPFPDRWIVASFPVLCVLLVTSFIQPIVDAPYRTVWNPVRLTPSLSLAAGYTLYYGPDSGPVTGNIYAPFSSIAYLPAAVASTPTTVLQIGTVLTLCFYFAPVLWLYIRLQDPHTDRATAQAQLYILALFPLVTFIRPESLGYVASLIHADAPAVGLAGGASAVLYANPANRWWSLTVSALLAVLSVWSKQVMGPLLLALPLWLGWSGGFRLCLRYLVCLLLAGLLVAGIFTSVLNARDLFFNVVTIPSRHPWDASWGEFPVNLVQVTREWLTYASLLLVLLALGSFSNRAGGPVRWPARNRWSVFLLAALAVLPTSLLGRLKVGGDRNALSFTLYLLLFAVCLMLRERVTLGRPWLAVVAVSGCALFLFRAQQERFDTLATPRPNVPEIVHAFIQAHPGEAYFPWNPLGHLLAEGRLYHFDYGLFDRELAGFPISAEHLRQCIPPNPRLVCFPEKANKEQGYVLKYLPEYSRRVEVKELPGFICYEREGTGP